MRSFLGTSLTLIGQKIYTYKKPKRMQSAIHKAQKMYRGAEHTCIDTHIYIYIHIHIVYKQQTQHMPFSCLVSFLSQLQYSCSFFLLLLFILAPMRPAPERGWLRALCQRVSTTSSTHPGVLTKLCTKDGQHVPLRVFHSRFMTSAFFDAMLLCFVSSRTLDVKFVRTWGWSKQPKITCFTLNKSLVVLLQHG